MSTHVPSQPGRPPAETLGQSPAVRLFEADIETVTAQIPSLPEGSEALADFMRAANPAWDRQEETPEEESDSDKPVFSRSVVRENLSLYGGLARRVIRAGAAFAASHEDLAEGSARGREILVEESDGVLLPLWDRNITRLIGPLRALRDVSRETSSEAAAVVDADLESRYSLLKLLASGTSEDRTVKRERAGGEAGDWGGAMTLSLMLGLNRSNLQERLSHELGTGMFDGLIARDVLKFVGGQRDLPSDLARVRQLATFITTFLGGNRTEGMNSTTA